MSPSVNWMRDSEDERVAFAVRHMEIDYLKPARIDDLLDGGNEGFDAIKGARMILDQRVSVQRRGNAVHGDGDRGGDLSRWSNHVACPTQLKTSI